MGYSIAVPVRSEKLRQKMQAFMDENFRDTTKIFPKVYEYSHASKPTNNLAYDNGKCRIGFNYNTAGSERKYIFAVTIWMALQIGRKRTLQIFQGTDIISSVPYYVYDGNEACPIRLSDEWKDKAPSRDHCGGGEWEMYDKFGWLVKGDQQVPLIKRVFDHFLQKPILAELQALHDEIKRLDGLWKETS